MTSLAPLFALAALILLSLLWRIRHRPGPRRAGVGLGALAAGAMAVVSLAQPGSDNGGDVQDYYSQRRNPPQAPLRVYHLGHSLVGRDMPAMLMQLAGPGHDYALQLGWGATLRAHYEPGVEIAGFDQENATPKYRDVRQALASRDYDAFVMTEMMRLSDAIKYHQTREYAAKWAAEAVRADPDIQIFVYESWHALDDGPDWLARLPGDLDSMWKPELLWPAARAARRPVWLIPVGQVMARLVAEAESQGGIAELKSRKDLFATTPEGAQDPIHPSDLGTYLVALTHYAVLYGKSPVGLPRELLRADGSPAVAPSPELARRMQEIVWEVVTSIRETGVPPGGL
ncbi:MAG: hypothetical protein U1E41_02605 [Paracoccus sp. (in: a-proteobacteria)]